MTVTHDQVQAQLTGPGQLFEMEEVPSHGGIRQDLEARPRRLPRAPRERAGSTATRLPRTRTSTSPSRSTSGGRPRSPAAWSRSYGVRQGRPGGHRHAQLPRVGRRFWAATAAGAIVVPLNAWWTAPELEYGLADSGAKVLIADGERVGAGSRACRPSARDRSSSPRTSDARGGARTFEDVLGEVDADAELPDGRDRPRGRRHDLLHLGHDRPAQGRARHPSQHLHAT